LLSSAQTLHPQAPGPLARLAVLLRGKLPETDKGAIQAHLERAGSGNDRSLPPRSPARGPLLCGLAHVLDAQGNYAEAADCLEQANALTGRHRCSPSSIFWRFREFGGIFCLTRN